MTRIFIHNPSHKIAKRGNNDERQIMKGRRQMCPRNSRK
jgi:hypothetical protein